jgi:predicted Zn-dependent protease with MMP-like domain
MLACLILIRVARVPPVPANEVPVPIMDPDPFEVALAAAIEALPEPYRRELASVAIVIQDEPDAAQLESVHARGLLGLYQGVPRTTYGASQVPVASKITLFRGPLMRTYRGHDALMEGVRETLDHEVAHHLGISDARISELQTKRPG